MATGPKPGTDAHEYASIFPLVEGQPLWELADRIKLNGLREPIVVLDGKILDGRRRELACIRAEVAPAYREFGSRKEDGDDPLEFVIDTNLHRRHLGEGDRALAAARYATAKTGKPKKISSQLEKITPTNAAAADKFDTTIANISRAKKVLSNGTPELQDAVSEGVVSVSDAAKVAAKPAEVQNEAVEAVRDGKARSAESAAKPKRSGTVKFDDRKVHDMLGKLARLMNDRANVLGLQQSKGWSDVREKMEYLMASFDRWTLELS